LAGEITRLEQEPGSSFGSPFTPSPSVAGCRCSTNCRRRSISRSSTRRPSEAERWPTSAGTQLRRR